MVVEAKWQTCWWRYGSGECQKERQKEKSIVGSGQGIVQLTLSYQSPHKTQEVNCREGIGLRVRKEWF